MARHWPIETRHEALRRIAQGASYKRVHREMGISVVTLRSWAKRYPDVLEGFKVAAARPQAPQEAPQGPQGYAGAGHEPGGPHGPMQGAPSSGPPPGSLSPRPSGDGAALFPSPLADMERAPFLRNRVALVERIVTYIMEADSPTYSALRPLLHLQSELHRELSEIVRAEGTRLDLGADPRELARAVDGMGRLLEILGADLDTPDTLDLSGLEDILGEVADEMSIEEGA